MIFNKNVKTVRDKMHNLGCLNLELESNHAKNAMFSFKIRKLVLTFGTSCIAGGLTIFIWNGNDRLWLPTKFLVFRQTASWRTSNTHSTQITLYMRYSKLPWELSWMFQKCRNLLGTIWYWSQKGYYYAYTHEYVKCIPVRKE